MFLLVKQQRRRVMAKTTVILDEQEVYELDAILIDEDSAEALRFLNEIKKKVKTAQARTCGVKSEY
jgi:hypothetical protein